MTLEVEKTIEASGVNTVVVSSPYIYATDVSKHRIVKMDMKGTVLASTGSQGDAPGQFNCPNGMKLGSDSHLYVCDTFNNRIQVFDRNLNFVRILGRKGRENGCLFWPTDLIFDADGNVYVSEIRNFRVQVLTPQGQHIRNIGNSGSNQEHFLAWPVSPAIHRDLLYVTDYERHCVFVFKTTGEFIKKLGENILPFPESMTIDHDGHIFVSYCRGAIIKF